jgi:hypothetical protein
VHGEELVVGVGVEEREAGVCELNAHEQREHAGAEEEEEAGGDVEDADVGVIDLLEEPEPARLRPRGRQALETVRACGLRIEWRRRVWHPLDRRHFSDSR